LNFARGNVAVIFAGILKVDPSTINDESSPDNVPEWDSVAAMHLVAAIEERFGVVLSTREIMSMRTVGLVRSVLRKKGIDDA
jgi:acyl carrier protein